MRPSTSCTPSDHLAIWRDSSSETIDAPMPQTKQSTSRPVWPPAMFEQPELTEHGHHDRDHHHHGDVGEDEEKDTLEHGRRSFVDEAKGE